MTPAVNRGGRPKKRIPIKSPKTAVATKRTRGAPKGMRTVLTVGRYTDLAKLWCKFALNPTGTKLPRLYERLAKKWNVSVYTVKKLVSVARRAVGRSLNVAWFENVTIDRMVNKRFRDFNVAADELEAMLTDEQLKIAHNVQHHEAPWLIELAFIHANFPEDRAALRQKILFLLKHTPTGNEVFTTVELGDAPPPVDATPFTVITPNADGSVERARRAFIFGERDVDWRTAATRQQLADRYARGKLLESEIDHKERAHDCAVEAFLIEPIVGKRFLNRVLQAASSSKI